MRQRTFIILLAFVLGWSLYSCEEYADDLRGVGGRVEALEDSCLKFSDLEKSIEILEFVANTNGFVDDITQENDGSYTIKLKGYFNGSDELTDSVIVLKMGVDGSELDDAFTITKIGDTYYWVLFGELLRDEFGNPVPVEALDGKDGKDLDITSGNYNPPILKINEYGMWVISYDGGNSWNNLKYTSIGEDGQEIPLCVTDVQVFEDYIKITYINKNGKEQTIFIPMLK